MNSKRWCVCTAVILLITLFGIAALNFVCDPFGVFGDMFYDKYSYNMTNNPRTSKIAYLEKTTETYDSYILGCSSTSSFDTAAFSEAFGCNFYNMIMYGADMADVEKTAEYLVKNKSPKHIVLNVYLGNAVTYDECSDKLTYGLHPFVEGKGYFSFFARHLFADPKYAVEKIKFYRDTDKYLPLASDVFDVTSGEYDKRKRDAEAVSELEGYYADYPEFADYPSANYTMPYIDECAESVARIKEMCDSSNVELTVVTAPVYGEYFHYFNKADITEFYEKLASATGGFWDFAVSDLSFEPRFFYDATHFKNDLGSIMVSKITGNSDAYIPEDFGEYVMLDNFADRVEKLYTYSFDDGVYTDKLPVLLYHHIDENITTDDVVSPETFKRHMKLLADNGYTAVGVDEILDYIDKGIDLPEKCVMITFDDGYKSNLIHAAPVLREHGLKATVFAIGHLVGKDTVTYTDVKCIPHFSLEEAELYSDVIDVQSHSYLLHSARGLAPEYIKDDMLDFEDEDSFSYAERIKSDCENAASALGKRPTALAFPHGKGSLELQAHLNEAGIRVTFTTEYETPVLIKGLKQSAYSLGRYTLYEGMSDEVFMSFLQK